GEHAAHVIALGRDDVEVGRGTEVDHDARRAVALLGRDGVRDPVGTHLPWIVVANADPGSDSGSHDEQWRLGPALRKHLVLADQRWPGRGKADAADDVEVDETPDKRTELIPRGARLGRDAPVLAELTVRKEAEDGLRVADVDRKQRLRAR